MTKTLIKNGRVIDPSQNLDGEYDVLIVDDKVEAIEPKGSIKADGAKEHDAKGLIVCPGFVDLHTHLREPGFEYKETIESGTLAAVSGGFTSVCCMANTNPVNDSQPVTDFILKQARENGHCHVYPVGAVTKGLNGEELANIAELNDAGCVAISDDGKTIQNAKLMQIALSYAKTFNLPVSSHSMEESLGKSGHMNSSIMSTKLGLTGIPNNAEDIIIARDIMLAENCGAHLHVGHVSTSVGIRLIRAAKKRGMKITCEVTPHHFTFTDEDLVDYDTNFKMYPPLRSKKDQETIKQALKDGIFDAIATDHAPHGVIEKELEFDLAAFGVIGLETALPASLALVNEGVIDLKQMITLLTSGPAKVFSLPKGTLKKGSLADITLFDLNKKWTQTTNNIASKSKNSPFINKELTGKVVKTFVSGQLKYEHTS